MNTDTGFIKRFTDEELEQVLKGEQGSKYKEVDIENLPPIKQIQLREKGETKIGRNDPCPCGSGKKFKRCCWTGKTGMYSEMEG